MGNIRIRWTRWLRVPGHEFGLASISTVPERTNAASFWGDQANSMTCFLFPNHGIGVGVSASPEATRYGLCARLSSLTATSSSHTITLAETSRRLRKIFLACARSYSLTILPAL